MFRFTDEDGTIVDFSRPAQAEKLAAAIARALGKKAAVILAVSDGEQGIDSQYRSGWYGSLDLRRMMCDRLKQDIEPLYTLKWVEGEELSGPRTHNAAFELAHKICETSGRAVVVTNMRTGDSVTVSR